MIKKETYPPPRNDNILSYLVQVLFNIYNRNIMDKVTPIFLIYPICVSFQSIIHNLPPHLQKYRELFVSMVLKCKLNYTLVSLNIIFLSSIYVDFYNHSLFLKPWPSIDLSKLSSIYLAYSWIFKLFPIFLWKYQFNNNYLCICLFGRWPEILSRYKHCKQK